MTITEAAEAGGGVIDAVKIETIHVSILTDADGKKMVGGARVKTGRTWEEVFAEAVKVYDESGGRYARLYDGLGSP